MSKSRKNEVAKADERKRQRAAGAPKAALAQETGPVPRAAWTIALTHWLATCAAAWAILSLLELAAGLAIKGAGLRAGTFDLKGRAGLVAWDLLVLASLVLIGGAVVAGVQRLTRPKTNQPEASRWTGRVVAWFIATLLAFAWLGSWGTFAGLNVFLDLDTVSFAASQGLQVFHWAKLSLLVAAIVAAPVLAAALLWAVPKLANRSPPRLRAALLVATAAGVALCGVLAIAGPPGAAEADELLVAQQPGTYGATPMGSMNAAQRYAEACRSRAGPFARLAADAYDLVSPPKEGPQASPSIAVRYEPILPTADYVARVDRAAFRPLNVLVIVVESLGTTPLRSYGGPREVMPAVDALAAESRLWRRAYAQATHSNYATFVPVSGQYPLRSPELYNYPPNPTYPRVMLYDLLKPLGYRTATFSSGNELWSGMSNFWRTGSLDKSFHAATWGGPTYVAKEDTGFASWVAQTRNAGTIDDRHTTDELIKWIGDARGGDSVDAAGKRRPFFAYFNPQNSHFPYVVPADFQRKFGTGMIDFPLHFNSYPPERSQAVRDLYDESLRYVDAQIGRLFAHLKATGQWDDTLVVLTGDHGQAFYEHGFATHANAVFEECLRVPLILRAPGLAASAEDEAVQHVDVMPTVLHAMGLPPHPAPQGVDLLDPARSKDRAIFAMAHSPLAHQYAIIRGRHKLMYDARLDAYALYDLQADPGERRDLLPTQPEVAGRLNEELQTWRAEQLEYYAPGSVKQKLTYPPVVVGPR